MGRLFEFGERRLDLLGVFALARFARLGDRGVERGLVFGAQLVVVFLQELFELEAHRLGAVPRFDEVAALLVFFGVFFGVFTHPFDFLFGQAGRLFDADLLFFLRAEVGRFHVQDTVHVDIEGNFDLRQAARRRRNLFQVELTEQTVGGSDFAFALVDLDRNSRLVVVGGAEDLLLFRRNRGVSFDQFGHDAAERFNTERQRGNVEQEHVCHVAREDARLNRRADRNDFVWVHALVRLFIENLLDGLLDLRDTGRTAHEHDFVNVGRGQFRVAERLHDRFLGPFDQVVDTAFEFRSRDADLQVLRPGRVLRDERQVDRGRLLRAELALRLFSGFLQALERHRVVSKVDFVLALEVVRHVVDEDMVKVVAAEVRVAVRADNLEDAVRNGQDGNVEGAAAEVEDDDLLADILVETISERRRGRFVHDTHDFQTGDLTGVFSRLTLRVVEVCGDRDDRLVDFVSKIRFGRLLKFAERSCGNFRRGVFLPVDGDFDVVVGRAGKSVWNRRFFRADFFTFTPHETFDRRDRPGRVHHRLTFCQFADEVFAGIGERDDTRGRSVAFRVRNNF